MVLGLISLPFGLFSKTVETGLQCQQWADQCLAVNFYSNVECGLVNCKRISNCFYYKIQYVRVLASQNDGKKQMALKCTEISFFHVLLSR